MSVLKQYREQAGLTQQSLAEAAGTSQPQIRRLEAGERKLTKEWAVRLAPHLAIPAERLLFPGASVGTIDVREGADADIPEAPAAEQLPVSGENEKETEANARLPAADTFLDAAVFKGPRNVPVYGTGIGGEDGDFRLNGQIIDHAPRPPGIENRRDVYVVYVVGDSVAPKYEDGDPIYVDPHRRPAPRDYVFVEMWGGSEDEPGPALIKRLVGRRAGKLYLEQHNPPKALEPIPEKAVKRVHRVIPWPELIGI